MVSVFNGEDDLKDKSNNEVSFFSFQIYNIFAACSKQYVNEKLAFTIQST